MISRRPSWLSGGLVLLTVCLFPSAARAQARIAAGQTVSGRLAASDPTLSDGSHYQLYEYRGRAGERIQITMRSGDFDTYLAGGTLQGGELDAEDSDDDGGGGTDSQLTVTVGPTGVYGIRANSLSSGETGAYTLTVELLGGATAAGSADGVRTIGAGETVSSSLDAGDAVLSDGSHYETYVYRGRPGEQIAVIMRSSDFDSYLAGGTPRGTDIDAEETNDDGAGGRDAMLSVTVPASGVYGIRANSLLADVTGSYTLTVQGGGAAASTGGARTVRIGETVAGRLQESTPTLGDGSHYDTYYVDATAGQRLFVTMTSGDFDTYLRWGRGDGSSFEAIAYDDDGGGGTNSRLEIAVESSGRYAIHANSYGADATGAYTLSLESSGGVTSALPSVALGQTVNGRLDASDPLLGDNSHYELYGYRGRAGEQVLVTMRSGDFDAYLAVGSMIGDEFSSDQSNDDGAGGTDAQILATLGIDGVLAIRANSLRASETGAFSLSVTSVSGAGAPAPTAPPGARIASAGQRLSGALRATDGMLADSSFFHDYVYGGAPGDRVRIVLESSDFDAYLQWGRLNGDRFESEASDDDGGGGTNSMIEAAVDGAGTFAIRVNSFGPGETGAYTLSVERLTGAAPVAEAPVAGTAGKWHYAYLDASDPVLRPLGQRAKQWGVLEQITQDLAARYVMPNDLDVKFDECGMVNAFYRPSDASLTFCYELLALLADVFLPSDGSWTQEAQDQISGAIWFIMMHEVGHALVHQLDLPITGREEDVADQLAVWTLMGTGEKGAQAAYAGTLAIQPATSQFEQYEFADEHSLGPVRLFNVLCWIYGSDPEKYGAIVADGHLPEERAVRCPGEWDRMSKAWQRLLAPYSQ
ncbi:MAG: DUF4344 domain-containing metallopeptidase [Gemmatimonadales bacterium]